MKKLQKKLQAIEELKKRRDDGDKLEENQVTPSLHLWLARVTSYHTVGTFRGVNFVDDTNLV